MDTIAAIRNRILQFCEKHKMTINEFADLAAIPYSTLKGIIYGRSQNPKILTIKMLCDGLGITLKEFFDTKEFNELEPEIK